MRTVKIGVFSLPSADTENNHEKFLKKFRNPTKAVLGTGTIFFLVVDI